MGGQHPGEQTGSSELGSHWPGGPLEARTPAAENPSELYVLTPAQCLKVSSPRAAQSRPNPHEHPSACGG